MPRKSTLEKTPLQSEEPTPSEFTDSFQLPQEISPHVSGVLPEAMRGINVLLNAHSLGCDLFQTQAPQYEEWMMLFIILANDAEGKSTVTKNFVEVTGRAYGTVRAALKRFEEKGYIRPLQKIGRAELYVPTSKLKRAVNLWGRQLWPYIEELSKENQSRRGTVQ